MARNFPRFLLSSSFDVNNKSKERYIVHMLHPQMVGRLNFTDDGGHQINPVTEFVSINEETRDRILNQMYDWYTYTRMKQAGLKEDFYYRTSDIAHKLAAHPYFHNGTVSISMVFKPIMGARLDVVGIGWNETLKFRNNDTYDSVLEKLQNSYRRKLRLEPPF